MWGWRAKIGFVIPCGDYVQELDAFNMAPEGVSVHFTRMPSPQPFTADALMCSLSQDLDRHLQLLTPLAADVIVFGCIAGSFLRGPGYDEMIARNIAKITGSKATTASTSVVAALRALNLKKISVLAPYKSEIVQKLEAFLKGNGLEVLRTKALDLDTDLEMAKVSPESIYQLARDVDVPEADGVFISCTTFRAADVIEDLERDLEKPVVTANQGSMWNALRMACIRDRIDGYGQLFKKC